MTMATGSLAWLAVSWSCPSACTVTTRAVSRYLPGFGTSTSQLNASPQNACRPPRKLFIGLTLPLQAAAGIVITPFEPTATFLSASVTAAFTTACALVSADSFASPSSVPSAASCRGFASATIAFFSSSNEQPPEQPPELGDFSWHELITTDPGAAFDFYSALAGWEKTGEHDMGPMGVYQMFGRQGHPLGGMFKKPADMPAPPHWMLYIRVADIDKSVDVVNAMAERRVARIAA